MSGFLTKWRALDREYQLAVLSSTVAFWFTTFVYLPSLFVSFWSSPPLPLFWGLFVVQIGMGFIPIWWVFNNEREAFEFPMYFGYFSLLSIPSLFLAPFSLSTHTIPLVGVAITFLMLILNHRAKDRWDILNRKTTEEKEVGKDAM